MREDFVTRLQVQLRDAAEREARRGAVGGGLRDALRSPALAGAVAAVLLALVVGAGALMLRDETPAAPAVEAELTLTDNPGQILAAYGSVWIADPVAGQVVRVDPERREATARIALDSGQALSIAAVGGELWTISGDQTLLQRIDPATDRVVGEVPLRLPDGRTFPALGLLATDRAVWAASAEGALQLDPRTGEPRRLAGGPRRDAEPRWHALGATTLWEYGTDGVLRRFDAVTGAPRGRIRPQLPQTRAVEDLDGDLVAFAADGRIGRLDGATGALRWQRAVGGVITSSAYGGGRVWVHGMTDDGEDRLIALDPRDGAVEASLTLRGFGSKGMAVVGDEVWINETGGRTIVIRS